MRRSIYQEDITMIKKLHPILKHLNVRQILKNLKEQGGNKIIVGIFSTLPAIVNRANRQEINKIKLNLIHTLD